MRSSLLLVPLLALAVNLPAAPADDDLPEPVPVGAGSYATRPPRNQAARPGVSGKAGWGDLSQVFTHMKLWVPDDHKGPVPSTDWWTTLVTRQWSGQLWAYPGMIQAEPQGVAIYFPKKWKMDGDKKAIMTSESKLLVRGAGFQPQAALAEKWSDWLVTMRLPQSDSVWMRATFGHGLPCTWIETSGVDLRIDVENPALFNADGTPAKLPLAGNAIGIETNGDCYGIFAPEGTRFEADGGSLAIRFSGPQKWITVAVLPARKDLATFQKYATSVPRSTKVTWEYQPEKGDLVTTWTLDTENLAGGTGGDVIQGWIPHHYDTAKGTRLDFPFNGLTYATPRGLMKCATGRTFKITYPFRGLLPALPAPKVVDGLPNPYRPDVMKELIDGYTSVNGYGTETYWGGKKILLFAKYMDMAHRLGLEDNAKTFQAKLKEALVDWATYTPGEPEHFFAMYPNWGSMVGFRTRDNQNPGIDVLQDHAFCYAYHVYAAALLSIYDPSFAKNYGEMAKLMVKDYANWDPADKRFPVFRSMDPWTGHSWSGGTGSDIGNGQESSSEAVQAWGAMFVLGEVLGDKQMRDTGIFGYVSESRAVAEYWFDRDKENIPRPLWPFAYNSNLETNGIGWWTWFSGDNFWMHAIQWLPASPLLKYLGEDPAFAKWDYETMWKTKSTGGWDGDLGTDAGVGNVTLSYLQLFDPNQAAALFDELWAGNKGTAHAKDESGPSYYRIHSGRALGKIRWDAWTDIPTSTVYTGPDGKTTVAVFNAADEERTCRLFENGKQTASFQVPPRKLIAHRLDSKPEKLSIETPLVTTEPGKPLKLEGRLLDQYGATTTGVITWSSPSGATVAADGTFTSTTAGTYAVTAKSGELAATRNIRVGAAPMLAKILFNTPPAQVHAGENLTLDAKAIDQYGDPYPADLTWRSDAPDLRIDADGSFIVPDGRSSLTITALSGSQSASAKLAIDAAGGNLLVGKKATASSRQGDDVDASKAADGSMETRWSSASTDGEWIAFDLGAPHAFERAKVSWENAYGKNYDIQASDDAQTWKTIGSMRDGDGGSDEIKLTGSGRFLRLQGINRGTNYGYSIFEFEVAGKPIGGGTVDNGKPVLARIEINPPIALMSDRQTQQFTAKGYDQMGRTMPVNVTWSVQGKGTISPTGLYTPNGGTNYETSRFGITASAIGVEGKAWAAVEESRRVAKITLQPAVGDTLKIAAGSSVQFRAEAVDQFDARYLVPITWTGSGNVQVDPAGKLTAGQPGQGTLIANADGQQLTVQVEVLRPEDVNIAALKPVTVSSVEKNGTEGPGAADGNPDTRWASASSDPQWIQIDLGQPYALKKVLLNWQNAAGKVYQIQTSMDGTKWVSVAEVTDGKPGVREFELPNAPGRYLRIYGTQRTTGYGYSLFEVEAYGTPMK